MLTKRVVEGLQRAAVGKVDPEAMKLVFERIQAYPLYEGNFGKAHRRLVSLALQKEFTYRQRFDWVFDAPEAGLRGEPFMSCDASVRR